MSDSLNEQNADSPLEGGQGGVNNVPEHRTSRFRNTLLPYNPKLKEKARELRKNSTLSEILFWKEIKKRNLGVQFHRQVPINEYVVDFYCHELMLAVEIDGSSHADAEACKYDQKRQKRLESLGVIILRIDDKLVKKDIHIAIQTLQEKIAELKRV